LAEITRDKLSFERIRKLKIVLFLTSGYFAAGVIGGLLTNSLALLADAGHMLTDVGGLALAVFAISYTRKPRTPQRTYGFYRIEILASLTNSVVLVLLSAYIFYEAYRRFFEPAQIQSIPMVIVAAIGLAVNYIGLRLLGSSHSHETSSHTNHKDNDAQHHHTSEKEDAAESLNIEGARLEVLSDTLGSIGVLAAGAVIITTNFYLADPIVSIALAAFILPRTWSLLKKSVDILMEGVPSNISYELIKRAILEVKGVTGVFELHIWSITSDMHALSAHVVIIDPTKSQIILQDIASLLEKRFNITHSTIQIETYHPESDSF
jgi:cobalt-zinc-cadmium efflux system protein